MKIKQERELSEKEEEIFEYIFNCIIIYKSASIDKLALEAINEKQINVFLKFYNKNKLFNLLYCLIKLIKKDDYETVEYLLDRHPYNKKSYKILWKATNSNADEDMQNLILGHRHEQYLIRKNERNNIKKINLKYKYIFIF